MDKENLTEFSTEDECRALKGTACDPNETMMITIYSKVKAKARNQMLKRKKLIGRKVMYVGEDNGVHPGQIIAFSIETGHPVLYTKNGAPPKAGGNLTFVEK